MRSTPQSASQKVEHKQIQTPFVNTPFVRPIINNQRILLLATAPLPSTDPTRRLCDPSGGDHHNSSSGGAGGSPDQGARLPGLAWDATGSWTRPPALGNYRLIRTGTPDRMIL